MSTPVDPAGLDDIHLSALARDGDHAAMRELWTRHHPAVLAAAHRVASQPRDAEEIASDAFSGMLAALSSGSGPTGSVRAYLLTSVHNGAITRSRRSIATILTDNDDVFENAAVAPQDPVGWANELGLMREAFATLPQRWQHVLWRTAVDLDSPATVAAELGLKPNTAAALAHRARQGLRRAYVQAHASRGKVDDECAPFIPKLATVLGQAGGRSGVAAHVDGCERCTQRVAELRRVDRNLPAIVLLGVAGVAPTGTATVATSSGASTTNSADTTTMGPAQAVGLAAAAAVVIGMSVWELWPKPEQTPEAADATRSAGPTPAGLAEQVVT